MQINFLSENRLGKWSIWSGVFLVALIIIGIFFGFLFLPRYVLPYGPSNFDNVTWVIGNLIQISIIIAGLVSFSTGILNLIKHKEWLNSLVVLYVIATLLILII